eukprot:scaffold33543_cov69-Phaeocystis_antarctica.AAC.1
MRERRRSAARPLSAMPAQCSTPLSTKRSSPDAAQSSPRTSWRCAMSHGTRATWAVRRSAASSAREPGGTRPEREPRRSLGAPRRVRSLAPCSPSPPVPPVTMHATSSGSASICLPRPDSSRCLPRSRAAAYTPRDTHTSTSPPLGLPAAAFTRPAEAAASDAPSASRLVACSRGSSSLSWG